MGLSPSSNVFRTGDHGINFIKPSHMNKRDTIWQTAIIARSAKTCYRSSGCRRLRRYPACHFSAVKKRRAGRPRSRQSLSPINAEIVRRTLV
jgi:hypothetical protein